MNTRFVHSAVGLPVCALFVAAYGKPILAASYDNIASKAI